MIPGASGGVGSLVGREFTLAFNIFSVLAVAFGRFPFKHLVMCPLQC